MRKSTDAVTKNKNCPHIFLAIGKMFWAEGKVQKARKFLERAVELDKDFADAWLYLYKFETIHNPEVVQQIKKDFDD
jgi:pre-mRNA-processing factor 6